MQNQSNTASKQGKMENGPGVKVLNERNLTIVRRIANDWQKLTPKRQTRKRYMKYEEMLMQEIPGASKKTNQAMHAVLESDLEDTEDDRGKGMGATVKVRYLLPLILCRVVIWHFFHSLPVTIDIQI